MPYQPYVHGVPVEDIQYFSLCRMNSVGGQESTPQRENSDPNDLISDQSRRMCELSTHNLDHGSDLEQLFQDPLNPESSNSVSSDSDNSDP